MDLSKRCPECGQASIGQEGEYPCPKCGLPTLWDSYPPDMQYWCDEMLRLQDAAFALRCPHVLV